MEGGKMKCQVKGTQHPFVGKSTGLWGPGLPGQMTSYETRSQLFNLSKFFIKRNHDVSSCRVSEIKYIKSLCCGQSSIIS